MDEQQLQNYIDWAKRGNLSGKSAARYFQLSGLSGSDLETAMAQMPVETDPNVYIQDNQPQKPDPYAGFEPIKQEGVKGQFDIDLGFIQGELIKKSEEEAVGILRNRYNRYGFKFDESVPGFDVITVTAPNGQQQKFNVAGALSEEDQRYYPNHEQSLARRASELVSFMNNNMIEDTNKINDLAKANYLETPRYLIKEDIDKDQKELIQKVKEFQADLDLYDELTRAYDVAVLNGEQDQINKIASELRDSNKDLENKRAILEEQNRTFESNYGSWYQLKANQGTWIGAGMNMLGKAFDGVVEGYVNEFLDLPLTAIKGLTDEQRRARKIDYTVFEDTMKLFSGTTDEYVDDLKIKAQLIPGTPGLTAQAAIALVESAPAFLAPGKVLRVATMGAMVLNDVDREMSGPEFEGVTENEKWLVKAPMAVVTSVLEEIGFRNSTQIKTMVPRLLSRALAKTKPGSKLTAKTLAEFVEQDVKSSLARGGLTLANAFFSEAETGALQEIAGTEIKRLWNLSKDRTDFDIPSSMGEYFTRVMKAAYMEGVGGFVLGSRSAYRSAMNPFTDGDLADMMILSNEDILEARRQKREIQVALGKMTIEQARAENNVDKRIHDIVKQIPEDASVSVQKQIFRKLQQESGLKDSVARKGVRMSKREQTELDAVRKEIDDIGQNYDRMTPEEKEQELREILQPITPTGGTIVETASGEKIEIKPEPVTAEESESNSKMEASPEPKEGVQLSLFDETTDQADQPVQEKPIVEEDKSDFAEIEISEATPEAMSEAGFSTEFQSIISKVMSSVGDKISRRKGDKVFNHRTQDSILQAVKRVSPEEAAKLQFGDFVFGFVHTPKNGGPQEIHLLDTNSAEFTDQVKQAAKELGLSYKIASATDLVVEEVVTHYMLQDFFGRKGTKRKEFYDKLNNLSKTNPALKRLIQNTENEYSEYSKAKQEEEVIAAFFKDYVNSPSTYRNIWQRIADWFNSKFIKGARVINSESDLMSVARNVNNIISGLKVQIETPTPGETTQEEQISYAKTGGSYLQNETIYYDFDRQAGVQYEDWANAPAPVPQKIRVSDYFHFRNWYNKMTANQQVPGIIKNMYFIKDGKKYTVNPPKPKTDKQGNLIEMQRIPTFRQIKSQRAIQESALNAEFRKQYSELSKDVGNLWSRAGLDMYTQFSDFIPEREVTDDLDFEGLVIAKKNMQALVLSNLTDEKLKEMRGSNNIISKKDYPEIFNMSGLKRFEEANNGDNISSSDEMSFGKTSGIKVLKGDIKKIAGRNANIINLNEHPESRRPSGKKIRGNVSGYDQTDMSKKGVNVGVASMANNKYKPQQQFVKKDDADNPLYGNSVVSSHYNMKSANDVLLRLTQEAAITAKEDGLKAGDEGYVFQGFCILNEFQHGVSNASANPMIAGLITRECIDVIKQKEKESPGYIQSIIPSVNNTLNSPGRENRMSLNKLSKGAFNLGKIEFENVPKGQELAMYDQWNIKDSEALFRFLEEIADGTDGSGFKYGKKLFIETLSKSVLGKTVAEWISENDYGNDYLSDEKAGHLIAHRLIKFTVVSASDQNGKETIEVDLGLAAVPLYGENINHKGKKYLIRGFDAAVVETKEGSISELYWDDYLYPLDVLIAKKGVTKATAQRLASFGGYTGETSFSKASARLSSKVASAAGDKGVSVDQLLQIAGKASTAEKVILEAMMDKFPDVKFIPKEDFDQFFEGKMLQPLEEERSHADYGLDRLYGKRYRKLVATTIPFVGDPEIYGTPGIFDDHFSYPVHAHVRIFTDPDHPGILYVSELQSDTYQKGLDKAFDGNTTEEAIIEDYAYDEVDLSVQNLPFLKHILENYDEFRGGIIAAAGGRNNAISADWWDNVLTKVEIVPENRIDDAPNMGSLLSNALANDPRFNVRAFRILLRQFALSNLKAPIDSTEKQIDEIINDHFNKYPYVQPGEKNNLGNFSKDLVITIDYMAETVSDIALGEELIDMTPEERMEVYDGAVEAVEKHRNRKKEEVKEGVSSAKNSWEKQIIRYTIKRAQENGDRVVRFPTEKTAADIQWWDADSDGLDDFIDEEFGIDRLMDAPTEEDVMTEAKQKPLRKRYRELPKTLTSIGLDSRLVKDENGNSWYEVDTPPSDQRMIMFSKASGRNNIGNIGGSTWEARKRTSSEEWTDLWLTRIQDRYRKVFQLQEDVSKKTQGQIRKDEDFRMAEELMYGKAANDLLKLDNATNRITSVLIKNSITIEDLDQYMYALHAQERNAVIRERTEGKNQMGSGMTDKDAQNILGKLSEAKKIQLEEAASIVREILKDTRETMVKLGLESQETIDAFEKMFKEYVPLQGKAKDEEDMMYSPYPHGGTGFSVSGATTKKAKGRFTESLNIVAQAISQNAAVHIKGRTNEAMNALYNLVENNPNSNVWEVLDKENDGYKSDDPNIVSVRVNGVQKAIRFKDASYAQSLRKMNMPQTNYFVKAMGSINSWLRAAFTSRNPEFILSNFSRDIQSAIFNASSESEIEGGFLNGTAAMNRIFKLVGPSLKALVKDEIGRSTDPLIMKYYEEFKADGGKTGWAYQKSLEDIVDELQIDDSGKTAGQKIIGGVKGALEFVEGMNDAFENSIRLSSYIAAREAGVSREKSAQFAKNITVNFNKQGEWGAAINATYLFFNASVQGTARIGRSLINLKPPVKPDGSRREWYERATTAQKAALGMVIMNGLLTMLNRAASDEDEDGTLFYNKIPDYIKERNMIIMRPDGENYWKIPMPYGYNVFANIGTTAVEVASGDKEAIEGLAFMAMSVVNAFSPVSFGQAENLGTQIAKTSIPTAFKPFFEAFAFNETYFGGPVKAEQYPFGTPKPNSSMSFRSPEEIKQFFSWINEATGGSEDVPGIIDINPDGGWYIFEYFLGGTGRFVTRSIETGRKIAADRTENPIDLDFNDIPFVRIVYGEPSKYYDMQLFKDREVEIKQLIAEYKNNRIPNSGDRYKGIGQLNEYLKSINKALKDVRAEKRAAKKIKDYGERISTIQRLMDRERNIVMMFNQKYEQFRGED